MTVEVRLGLNWVKKLRRRVQVKQLEMGPSDAEPGPSDAEHHVQMTQSWVKVKQHQVERAQFQNQVDPNGLVPEPSCIE